MYTHLYGFYLKLNRDYFLRLILQFGLRFFFVCAYMCSYVQMHVYIWVHIHVHICMWRPEVNLRWCFLGAVHLCLRQGLSLDLVRMIRGGWMASDPLGLKCLSSPASHHNVFLCVCVIYRSICGES